MSFVFLSKFEFLGFVKNLFFVIIRILSLVTIFFYHYYSQFNFFFSFHYLSSWVLSQFEFLNFVRSFREKKKFRKKSHRVRKKTMWKKVFGWHTFCCKQKFPFFVKFFFGQYCPYCHYCHFCHYPHYCHIAR